MSRRLVPFLLILLLPVVAFAVDTEWGGALQSFSEYSNVEVRELTFGNSLTLWTDLEWSRAARLGINGGVAQQFDKGNFFFYPELYFLAFHGRSGSWGYRAGRFTMSDLNNRLMYALVDGLEGVWESDRFRVALGAGFTGLAFTRTSRVIMTAADQINYDDPDSVFASPRTAQYVEASWFGLPGDSRLTLALLFQQDMRDAQATYDAYGSAGGLVDTQYLKLDARGRFTPRFFYEAVVIGETGLYNVPADDVSIPVLAGAGALRLNYLFPGDLKPSLGVEFLYSSGDPWSARASWEVPDTSTSPEALNQYWTFTTRTAGYVYASRIGNLVYGQVFASFKPADTLQIVLDSFTFFRAENGPVNEVPVTSADGSDRGRQAVDRTSSCPR